MYKRAYLQNVTQVLTHNLINYSTAIVPSTNFEKQQAERVVVSKEMFMQDMNR